METAEPVFSQLGRGHARSGLSLAALLTSYQAGARAAWRHMAGTAVQSGAPAPEVALLAEAVFWLVDHLSAASARGYTEEQSARAAQRERARAELSDLLLSDRADLGAVDAAATRAHWPMPAAIAVVLFAGEAPADEWMDERLPGGWLGFQRGSLRGLLVGTTAGAAGRAELATAFRGTPAVVGPAVPPGELPGTLDLVQVALRLRRDAVLDGDPVFVADHLDAVIVHRDPQLLAALARDALAPLAELSPESRQRLEGTLGSWLRLLGDHRAMARELHVHPQTVRYRLGQLRTLFGPELDDPSVRRRLTLALFWRASADG
jgi:hypothetical protein